MNCDGLISIGLGYGLDDQDYRDRIPARSGIFLFTTVFRPAQVPAQLPIQWVQGAISHGGGGNGQGVKLIIHLHLVPR
jgi:hypothetical protein